MNESDDSNNTINFWREGHFARSLPSLILYYKASDRQQISRPAQHDNVSPLVISSERSEVERSAYDTSNEQQMSRPARHDKLGYSLSSRPPQPSPCHLERSRRRSREICSLVFPLDFSEFLHSFSLFNVFFLLHVVYSL